MKEARKSPLSCPYTVTVRRNPHRKARPPTTSTKCPQTSVLPSSSTVPEVPSFPIDEILAIEVPSRNPKPNSDSDSENLRVFLRIRPLLPSTSLPQNPKSRAKNAWPQNPAKKNSAREKTAKKNKSSDVCIIVNDSQSVTLSPPSSLQDSKRIKSEVFEGFSHVFAPDSSQEQVYEKMMNPLVEDFLRGKSGMIAALGPSGSGKTHTVFGCPRDPGVVPRTLQRIFKPALDTASVSRRSFNISIFEILSERGKGEKLFDLLPGGAELSMRQSTVKGLQEVIVSDAREAASLVSQAMLRRLTAMTNSNTQSSRSQCIIKISSVRNNPDGEDDSEANNAVLNIIDLAGAEREKKTGNQGARLLESNFINNTSMVFGLCLRSLLEHQKNPKRPLQKHFQNSLLTRYLRDYLEGKKRMALMLTVKSGEEDYLDATYLLRQASPFMRIMFDNVEEQSNIPSNKRQNEVLSRREKPKRMKFSGPDACAIGERKTYEEEHRTPGQVCSKESNYVDMADRDRSYQILQNFSKALWSVLKQYGEKLKVAEHEIQHLTENLKLEKTRNVELEKKLEDFMSCCTCSQQKSAEAETKFKPRVELNGLDSSNFNKSTADLCSFNFSPSQLNCNPKNYDSGPRQDKVISCQKNVEVHSSNKMASGNESSSKKCDSNFEQNQSIFSQAQVKEEDFTSDLKGECTKIEQAKSLDVDVVYGSSHCAEILRRKSQVTEEAFPSDLKGLESVDKEGVSNPERRFDVDVVVGSSLCVETSQQRYQIDVTFSGAAHNAELHGSRCLETNDTCSTAEVTVNSSQPLVRRRDSCSSVELDLDQLVNEEDQELLNLPKIAKDDVEYSEGYTAPDVVNSESGVEKPEELLDPSTSAQEDLAISKECKGVDNELVQEDQEISEECKDIDPLNNESVQEDLAISKVCKDVDILSEESVREDLAMSKECKVVDPLSEESVREDLAMSKECKHVDPLSNESVQEDQAINKECKDIDPLSNDSVQEDLVISKECKDVDTLSKESAKEDIGITKHCKVVDPPSSEQRVHTPPKPGKPKRRLLPASSVLLRDFNTLDAEDKSEKRKGNRGVKKFSADERTRTQGSISLLRMLQSNIRS
ncbi:kinesin-like protein KIN-6 [Morus notabilis]|uniref:kinesin-like protein KIN-6 n=1 Tax=Morus notabilis TaxID=981085 RepID=UPI000CED7A9E|nr:kinesin-like protein KIN-6 [Morus notabilis]